MIIYSTERHEFIIKIHSKLMTTYMAFWIWLMKSLLIWTWKLILVNIMNWEAKKTILLDEYVFQDLVYQ